MVVWAANFVVVKDVIAIVPPVAFSFAALRGLGLLPAARSCAGREGSHPSATVTCGGSCCSARSGSGRTRCSGPSACRRCRPVTPRCLIASTPVFTAVIAFLIGCRHARSGQGRRRRRLVRRRRCSWSRRGVGIELSGSPVGFILTLGAALCWAIFTSMGARRDAHPDTAVVHDLGRRSAGSSCLAPIGLGAAAGARCARRRDGGQRPDRALRDPVLGAHRGRGLEHHHLDRGPAPRPDAGDHRPGARPRAWRSSSRSCCWASPSTRARSSAARSSCSAWP